MSSAPNGFAPSPPVAPGRIEHRPVWPTVLGIVAIVLGGGGILANLWGVASALLFNAYGGSWLGGFGPPGFDQVMDEMRPWQARLAIASAAAACVSGMLLAVGIGLVKRRAWSRPLTFVWAWLRMAVAVVVGVLTYFAQKAQFDAMAESGQPGLPAGMGSMLGGLGLVFAITWGFALSVFMLIWFNVRGVREQVRAWRRPSLGA